MTVAASPRRAGPYAGNGVTTSFSFGFKVFARSDVGVVYTDANGVATTLILDSDYSILLNLDQDANPGGTVTYPATVGPTILPAGATLTMIGALTYDQQTDITNSGRFLPQVIEDAFDKRTIQIQQILEVLGRTLQAAVGTTVKLVFPAPSSGKFIRWRSDLTGLENVEAGTDSTVLQGLLADSAVNTRGAGMSGFNVALTYPASTVGATLKSVASIPDFASSANGASLVGYKAAFTGAVGRTLQSKLLETISAGDFGLKTSNTGAQNVTALQAAVAYSIAQGGASIFIPRGTYDFNAAIDTTGANNMRIYGEGPDATVLRMTSTTARLFTSTGSTFYRTFEDFSVVHSVTRIAGSATFYFEFERRGLFRRIKVQNHADAFNLYGFEQVAMTDVFIVNPSAAGFGVICGHLAAPGTNTGANLMLTNLFLRGNDEVNNTAIIANTYGLVLNDIEAVWGLNIDSSNMDQSNMVVQPSWRCANVYFSQCFFDGTKNGHGVLVQGAGAKANFSFNGGWFCSAGGIAGGGSNLHGIYLTNNGTYTDVSFTGNRFYNNSGDAMLVEAPGADFTVTGNTFFSNGVVSATYKYGIQISPPTTQTIPMVITGNKFRGQGTADVRAEATARLNVVTGNQFETGIGVSTAAGAQWGGAAGNVSPTASYSIASAATISVPPTAQYISLSGTTPVANILTTYPGHLLAIRFLGTVTWLDDAGNVRLNGNLSAVANTMLTLVCEANGDWRELTRCNT